MSRYYRTLLSLGTPAPPVFVAAVSDLVASAPTDTTIDLAWTAPVGSDNAIDYYEVWLDGVFYQNTIDDSVTWTVTGLTLGTEYDLQLKTVDVFGNKSALSNLVTEETTGAITLVTDLVSGFIHGYSQARKLRNAYSGNILEVRRSSDWTALNIGEVSNELDESALTTFVGANNGFARTLYDQVGSRNMLQAAAANQPQIVTAGAVIRVSGKPYSQYDGSNDFMATTSATPIADKDCTVFVVFESQATGGTGVPFIDGVFEERESSIEERIALFDSTSSSNGLRVHTAYKASTPYNQIEFPVQQPVSTKRCLIYTKSGTTVEAYDETGLLIGSFVNAGTFLNDTLLTIGRQLSSNLYCAGKIAELLINNKALSTTDRNLVLNNIKTFYSIT